MPLPLPDLEPRLQKRYKRLVSEYMNSSQAIAPGICSLPGRGKAFACTQAAWRFYSNHSVTLQKLAEPLSDCARQGVADECNKFALVVHDWTDLHYSSHSSKLDRINLGRDFGYKLHTALLLSDKSGLPLAPVSLSIWNNQGVLTTQSATLIADVAQLDALIDAMQFLDAQQWGKPAVHILDLEADSIIHLSQWDSDQHYFVVRGKELASVIHEGRRKRLIDVAEQIEFRNGGAVAVGPNLVAQELIGEATARIDRPGCPNRQVDGKKQFRKRVYGHQVKVRLIVSQLRLPDETIMAQRVLISNLADEVKAETISQFYYWRWSIESFFKLMKSGGHQLEQWQQESAEAIGKRLLLAAMASVTTWQIMRAKGGQGERVRGLLIRLSGRQVRRGKVSAGQFKEVMLKLATQHLSEGGRLPVATTIETLALSRATHYRHRASAPQPDPDTQLRDHIQHIALDWPCYGYRRISAELHRQGITANHKRVLRLMREDNLLCLRKRRFICTTDSKHSLSIYPNLVPDLTVCSINQLWVADITYIRLLREFIYLAVILDAYSRRCIGWALEAYLEAELAVEALRMALANREVKPGLVHQSDRGVQYASSAYTD